MEAIKTALTDTALGLQLVGTPRMHMAVVG